MLATGEGRIIMTACRPQQKSRVGQLTLFTQALVEGLRGQGVVNCNGYVSAFGLYDHLYESVKERAADLGDQQAPELTVLRGVGPLPIALYRGATSLGLFNNQEPLPSTPPPHCHPRTQPAYAQTLSPQIITTVGERGVNIGGNATDNTIITGDNNTVRRINTSGDTYGAFLAADDGANRRAAGFHCLNSLCCAGAEARGHGA
jgi:hypothetical protein